MALDGRPRAAGDGVGSWHGAGAVGVRPRCLAGYVMARQAYPDGRVVYQVEITMPGADGLVGTYIRSYAWPQPALAAAVPPQAPAM